jgi:hypothetical protein
MSRYGCTSPRRRKRPRPKPGAPILPLPNYSKCRKARSEQTIIMNGVLSLHSITLENRLMDNHPKGTNLYRVTAAERASSSVAPFTFASHSIAHEGHPERNEDTILVDRGRGLASVFDGVGGVSAGEIASQLAARVIRRLGGIPCNNSSLRTAQICSCSTKTSISRCSCTNSLRRHRQPSATKETGE